MTESPEEEGWPEAMDRKTLARYLRISERSVNELVKRGELPRVQVLSMPRYRRKDVDAYLYRLRAS